MNRIINYSAVNGDSFIIGNMLGAASLGLYNRAYNLMNLPLKYISRVLSSVLFPAFSEVQNDPARFKKAYLESTQIISIIAAPVMAGIAVAAPYLIIGLYGQNWSGAIVPLQILAGAGYFRALYHIGGSVAHASNNVYSELTRQAGYAALVIIGAIAGSPFGIIGVATGISIALLYMFFAMAQLSLSIIGASWGEYFEVQFSGIVVAAVTGTSAVLIRYTVSLLNLSSWLSFLLIFLACGLGFILGLYLMPRSNHTQNVIRRIYKLSDFLPLSVQKPLKKILWITYN